jgi:hypothetical protein
MISTKWSEYAQAALRQMVDVVKQHRLELLQRYPDDLMISDLGYLKRYARPGVVFAWCVGDCHSHLTMLGFTKADTELVSALTNLANNDRFFRIRCLSDDVVLDALSREQFSALATTPVPYQVKNTTEGITFWRHDEPIGAALIRRLLPEPQQSNASYEAIITPKYGVTEVDLAAFEAATCRRIHELGSLFAFYNITVAPPVGSTATKLEDAYA